MMMDVFLTVAGVALLIYGNANDDYKHLRHIALAVGGLLLGGVLFG